MLAIPTYACWQVTTATTGYAFCTNAFSILQSCGKLRTLHLLSLNKALSAPAVSVCENCQLKSINNLWRLSGGAAKQLLKACIKKLIVTNRRLNFLIEKSFIK